MKFELLNEWRGLERIHADEVSEICRSELRFSRAVPLAVERTTLAIGAFRPPVILVHGFAQNRYTWRISERSMSGYLAAAGFDVYNLELRGHGNSRAYGAGNARAFAEYVDDLVEIVNQLDQPPFVIGHSLGGAVAVGAATRVPLAGLIPIAGVFRFATQNPTLRALARISLRASPILEAGPVRMSTGWAGRLLGQLYGLTDIAGYGLPLAGWVPGSLERHLLEERLALGFDWTSVEVWLQMCRWALGEPFEYQEAFSKQDLPLFVIAGDSDPLLHAEDARSCYEASNATDKRFVVFDAFDHGHHFGHLDLILGQHAPDIVWPQIREWLVARS